MFHLIKKDIVIHHLSWLLYIGMAIFFTIFDKDPMFIIALMSAIVMMNMFYFDEEANGYKLWMALPFTRNEIVSARYISLLVVSVAMTAFIMLLNKNWDIEFWLEVLGSIITILLTAAICFPIFYIFAQRRVMVFLLTMYIIFVIAVVHGFYYLYVYLFDVTFISQYLTTYSFYILITVISMVIYVLSWLLSIKIYNRKEIL